MTTTKDEAINLMREALQICYGIANIYEIAIVKKEASAALAATSHIAPDAAAIQAEPVALEFAKAIIAEQEGAMTETCVFCGGDMNREEWEDHDDDCVYIKAVSFVASLAIAPEASELPPKLNYSASDDYKKWWDGNRAKLANHSFYTKGAVIWNAAIAMCQKKGSQHE